jgi:hypothetical protein
MNADPNLVADFLHENGRHVTHFMIGMISTVVTIAAPEFG